MLFISHTTRDDADVNTLAEALEAAGLVTWVDHRQGITPGMPSWDAAIRDAIRDSQAGVFVMSPRSLASEICAAECLLVRELDKPLYVVQLTKPEPADIWLYIKLIQYADLTADFAAGVQSLVDAINGKTGPDLPVPVRGRLTGADAMRLNLPYLHNPLRGRAADLDHVQNELGPCVLQIVGPGGLGKSRLCAEVALNHPNGAVWHRCSPVSQSVDLLALLRAHLRLPDDAPQTQVLDALDVAPPLVVVDNAEDVTAHRRQYADLITLLVGRRVPVLLTARTVWTELKPRKDHTPPALSDEVGAQIALDFAASEGLSLPPDDALELARAARLHPRLIEFAVGQLHERGLDRVLRQLRELRGADIRDALDEMIVRTVEQMRAIPGGSIADSLLRRLTILQGTFTFAAAQALAPAGLDDEDDLDDALVLLQRWQFVRRDAQTNRYSLGPLLREALGVPDDDATFNAYADFVIEQTAQFAKLPPQDWGQLDPLLPHVHEVGDTLVTRFNVADSPDEMLLKRVGDFAYNITKYVDLRPQLVETEQGRRLRGMNWLEMGLAASGLQGNHRRESLFLNEIAGAWFLLGEKHRALRLHEEALSLRHKAGDVHGEATTLNNLGGVWDALGDKRKALKFYEKASSLYRIVGDSAGEAATLNNIGCLLEALGEIRYALECYDQALGIVRGTSDRRNEAITLNNIGLAWSALGESYVALEYYEQTLPLFRAVGDRNGEATALNSIGSAWSELGEKYKALEFYEQALTIIREIGNRRNEAAALNNIGSIWFALCKRRKALEFYEQALPMCRAVGDRRSEAATLGNIGNIYFQNGELERAVSIQEQIIAIVREIGAVAEEALYHHNIAVVLQQLERIDEAIVHIEQGRTILVNYNLPQAPGGATLAEYDDFLARLVAGDGETPSPAQRIPVETVQQLAGNTVAVMTSHTDKRDGWRANLDSVTQQAKQNNDAEVQAFCLALLAVLDGGSPSLPDDNPYADVLRQVIAAIVSHNQGGGS